MKKTVSKVWVATLANVERATGRMAESNSPKAMHVATEQVRKRKRVMTRAEHKRAESQLTCSDNHRRRGIKAHE